MYTSVASVASFVSVVFVFMATIGLSLIVVIYDIFCIIYNEKCLIKLIIFNLINETIQWIFSWWIYFL